MNLETMRKRVDELIKDKNCSFGIIVFFFLFIWFLSFFIFRFPNLPPQVPLFYSRPWGEEQLAAPSFLGVLLAGVLLVAFFNFGMAGILLEEFPFLARIFVWSTVLISLLAGVAIFKTITLIT